MFGNEKYRWNFLPCHTENENFYKFRYIISVTFIFFSTLFRSYVGVSERPNPISYFPDGYPLMLILFIKYIVLLHWFEIPALSETNPSIYLHLFPGYLFSSCTGTKLF